MELRHLRYFIRAAELLNFTKAAESLYVSQPTLSVQIHQLEEELGAELFARVGRNVQLTESGQVFLSRALQAVKELEEGGKEIDAIKGLLRGSLCLASLPLFGSRLLAGWISAFSALHPRVQIRVKAAPTEDIEIAILAGTVDLGLSFVPGQHAELNSKKLFDDEIVAIASVNHEIARKKNLAITDFSDLPLVLPSERISATRLLTRYFEEHKIQPNLCMTFDDGHAMIELVKKGKFVTVLPKGAVKEDPELCFRKLPAPGIAIEVGILWTNLTPAARVFLDLMTEQAKNLG